MDENDRVLEQHDPLTPKNKRVLNLNMIPLGAVRELPPTI